MVLFSSFLFFSREKKGEAVALLPSAQQEVIQRRCGSRRRVEIVALVK
jgi:hypothetical protein